MDAKHIGQLKQLIADELIIEVSEAFNDGEASASELSDAELAYTIGGNQKQLQQAQPVQGKSGSEKFFGSLFGSDKGASDAGGGATNQA